MRKTILLISIIILSVAGQIANAQEPVQQISEEEMKVEQEASDSQHVIDSLLAEWYKKRPIPIDHYTEFPNLDEEKFTTEVPDSILIMRLEKMNSFITLPFSQTVKNYMLAYTEKNPERLSRLLAQSAYYFPIFEEILDKYDMPLELKYMSIIESALNPVARSRVGARGIWQFMFPTAKRYGLKINSFVDERLDVVKAADAAARYLKDAYNVFGDWALAISSYNCGAGNVNKAIKIAGSTDFWSIYPYLPRETRGYVPAFVGAMYAMTYYNEYGVRPGESPLPIQVDTFEIRKNLHFKQISDLVGIPTDMIKELNPQYTHDIVPGNEGPYVLKLPYNFTGTFIAVQDTLYKHMADSLLSAKVMKSIQDGGNGEATRYKVRSGDNLGAIARRNHCTVTQLKKWNHLRSDMIRVGQILYIYR